ncbi:MAG: terminase small subunit [Thermoplasmataceae archaeon]
MSEYLKDLDGAEAAIRCGYSPRTADSQASRLLKNAKIAQAIQRRLSAASARADVTPQKIIEEYARLAFLDPGAFYDTDGTLLPIHKMPEEARRALTGIDIDTVSGRGDVKHVTKIRYAAKIAALDALARINSMFKDNLNVTGDLATALAEARKRRMIIEVIPNS